MLVVRQNAFILHITNFLFIGSQFHKQTSRNRHIIFTCIWNLKLKQIPLASTLVVKFDALFWRLFLTFQQFLAKSYSLHSSFEYKETIRLWKFSIVYFEKFTSTSQLLLFFDILYLLEFSVFTTPEMYLLKWKNIFHRQYHILFIVYITCTFIFFFFPLLTLLIYFVFFVLCCWLVALYCVMPSNDNR